jgi:superfamily II DNA or RNA helicase
MELHSKLILRDYQQDILNKVLIHLEHSDRCCVSLSTGGGKTALFTELINHLKGKTIVLVHREELVHQTSKHINKEYCIILPKTKYKGSDIVIAMVQTLSNRIKKKEFDLNDFDNIIVDEAHRGDFIKIIEKFKGKVIGFTATPNYEKTEYVYICDRCGSEYGSAIKCCNIQNEKYKENVPLSTYYHTLIDGIGISELIDKEFLVPEESYIYEIDEKNEVWDPKTGEMTQESVQMTYGSKEGIEETIRIFKENCYGLKTIIFNPNTLVNKLLYDAMILEHINAKMYDSKNEQENRSDLMDWFRNTKDAVLLNVQVFTTGVDVTDIECIFLNKKTRSINLYLQMVGRGGRITNKIFKPKFKVIDIGNTQELFGNWSDEREWDGYFYNKHRRIVGKPKPAATRICHNCEALLSANSLTCDYCGAEKQYTTTLKGVLKNDAKIIIPKPDFIVKYCSENNLDCNDARKIAIKYIVEMFNNVPFESFVKHKKSGLLFNRSKKFLLPYYFAISASDLKGNKVRKIDTFTDQLIIELKNNYESRITDTA